MYTSICVQRAGNSPLRLHLDYPGSDYGLDLVAPYKNRFSALSIKCHRSLAFSVEQFLNSDAHRWIDLEAVDIHVMVDDKSRKPAQTLAFDFLGDLPQKFRSLKLTKMAPCAGSWTKLATCHNLRTLVIVLDLERHRSDAATIAEFMNVLENCPLEVLKLFCPGPVSLSADKTCPAPIHMVSMNHLRQLSLVRPSMLDIAYLVSHMDIPTHCRVHLDSTFQLYSPSSDSHIPQFPGYPSIHNLVFHKAQILQLYTLRSRQTESVTLSLAWWNHIAKLSYPCKKSRLDLVAAKPDDIQYALRAFLAGIGSLFGSTSISIFEFAVFAHELRQMTTELWSEVLSKLSPSTRCLSLNLKNELPKDTATMSDVERSACVTKFVNAITTSSASSSG
ncbi:hypothetical protein EUX98_g4780 [Antrodiella citrinella]|uniref:Uncharacterized protein n=1 Tax=Antrodiella citrinella TaxID=2447956 RepID=A0A4S4MTC2_9APHY|nr:hypothetical protein EUX98_g4780 [Antrodiella citrinella]